MFLSILMGFPMVMLPTQLLLVNLVTDDFRLLRWEWSHAEKTS